MPSGVPVDARWQLLDQEGAETETDTMSAHSHHPPTADSPVLPRCLWPAASAGGVHWRRLPDPRREVVAVIEFRDVRRMTFCSNPKNGTN
ncbi:hypothetical protein CVV72_10255 [Amycolatopsis sp. TNS106]|nr:hypothetical protein CVV72_10255 [Amycolatopsis sp. TNS106]